MADTKIAAAIKEMYPNIDWDRFEDIDKALNFDLWYGTASEYFGEDKAEPLEHYEWKGFMQAEKDLVELLDPLPHELYWDGDAEFLTDKNPEDDEYNWRYHCKYCDELLRITSEYVDGKLVLTAVDDTDGDCCSGNYEGENENEPHEPDYDREVLWFGGEEWRLVNVRKELMFDETFKQVF